MDTSIPFQLLRSACLPAGRLIIIGGAVHVPSSASFFGQYSRNTSFEIPLGAGSQLGSLSLPGYSCCT